MRLSRTRLYNLAVALWVGTIASCSAPAPESRRGLAPEEKAIAEASNAFAFDLYRKLADREKGNLFFSPYSVHTALTMTAHGANGQTRDEMVKALHLPADRANGLLAGDLAKYYSPVGGDYELTVANALWGQKDFGFRPLFLEDLRAHYDAGFQEVDFVADREAARLGINRWVEDRTRKRIPELVKAGDIDSLTRMVLANAVAFKGTWVTQFDKKRTADAPFRCADGTKVQTPFMAAAGFRCRSGYQKGLRLLELPYRGDDLAMLVIVPDTPHGIATLDERLDADTLKGWVTALEATRNHEFHLPKFTTKTRHELNEPLQALGMVRAFDVNAADFSDIHNRERLFIGKVVHQAFVEVNEEGTEAAAATGVTLQTASARPFYVDRPFVYLIRDVKNGTILFLGRVMNPKE